MNESEVRGPIAHRNFTVLEVEDEAVVRQLLSDERLRPLIWRRVGSSQLVLEAEAMERVIEILQSSGLTMAYVARTGDRV